jgi:nucleotidyltransferase/DNA polymerase involved in DNA repair
MPISCDEAYLKLSGLFTEHEQIKQIKLKILQQLQLYTTIGLGENLIQARIATKLAKPNGFLFLN